MPKRLLFLLITLLSATGCVQSFGLVFEGNISLPTLQKDEELWLGLWIQNAKHPEPFSGTPLVAIQVDDIVVSATSTIGDFKWETGVTPEGGVTLWLAAFPEKSTGANGIPDEGVTLIPADQNPIKYITANIIKSSDGKVKYKPKITISSIEAEFDPKTSIAETVDAFTEILQGKAPASSGLMTLIHPFYRDVFLNSYNRLADWFSGSITTSLRFGDVPLYGILDGNARSTISVENTGFDAGSGLKIDPLGLSTEAFFTYVRTDNNNNVAARLKLFFRNDEGKAKILEILPVYSSVESFSLVATPPYVNDKAEILLKWDTYANASTYRIDVERWDKTQWYTQSTTWHTKAGVTTMKIHPTCASSTSIVCLATQLQEDQFYRLSLIPLDNTGTEISAVHARFYLPGNLYHYGRN